MVFLIAISLIFVDLASVPGLYHVERFVFHRDDIRDLCAFNRQYRIKIGAKRDFFPDSYIIPEIEKECDLLWKAWDALDDAKNEMFSVYRRRKALNVLINTIGLEMFMRGEKPPHVPYWRFVEVR